ncbi:MAG: hypothetical protein ACI9SX_000888 [Pseudoalteromonas tetraodonis]|jgi:hypothetical protein
MLEPVSDKFSSYPDDVQGELLALRALILKAAEKLEMSDLEETLKWGEPAYLCQHGSTIRINWKPKASNSLYVFFNRKTILVETFRELYQYDLKFLGNRAIVLNRDEELSLSVLESCFSMALRYHHIKHLPLLGSQSK